VSLRIRKKIQEMLRKGRVSRMMTGKSFTRLALPVLVYCLGIFGLSSMSTVPEVISQGWDKVAHIVLYAGLGWLSSRCVERSFALRLGWAIVLAGVFCLVYGISDEFHQWFVPGRSAEVGDVMADFVGGLIGSAAYVAVRGREGTKSNRSRGVATISEARRA
jgi:VanZ family protein